MSAVYPKLKTEAAGELNQVKLDEISPYALLLSPVYLYMKRNEKFVCLKGALDFFSPSDLKKYQSAQTLFVAEMPEDIDQYRSAARRVLKLLRWSEKLKADEGLPVPPYILSKSIIQVLRELWQNKDQFDTFAIVAFVEELCGCWEPALLDEARADTVEFLEKAILRASWCVFMAIHLGHHDEKYLKEIRNHFFYRTINGNDIRDYAAELEQLYQTAEGMFPNEEVRTLAFDILQNSNIVVHEKVFQRVKGENG